MLLLDPIFVTIGAILFAVVVRVASDLILGRIEQRSAAYHKDTFALLALRIALRALPRQARDRYSEEWLDFICEQPSSGMRAVQAMGLVISAIRIDAALAERPINLALKRAFDIVVAAFALIVLGPLFLVVLVAMRLSGDRQAFFSRQQRIGLGGRDFFAYKIGTVDVQGGRNSSLSWIGRLLQRTSVDELPQLVNVLLGSMSLVGPRPHAGSFTAFCELDPNYAVRVTVRPGLTGLAQVNGLRGPTDLAGLKKRVEVDLAYIRQFSFVLDMKIIWRTLITEFVGPATQDDKKIGHKL